MRRPVVALVTCLLAVFWCVWARAETSTAIAAGSPKIFGGSGMVDKSMNPAISVNGLFLGAAGNAAPDQGLTVQEVEAIFSASVDPYFYSNIVLSMERVDSIEVEEAYAVTLAIPAVNLKFGKFLANFGKNNLIHTHGQQLIDRPLVNRRILGDEGLNSIGLEASWLVPVPWYLDLTVGTQSASRADTFQSPDPKALTVLVRMDHLFDLSDATTLGLGGSFATSHNAMSERTHLFGGDLTLKYVEAKGRGTFAVAWTNEILFGKRNGFVAPDAMGQWGLYSTLLLRLSQIFWVGGRFDYYKETDPVSDATKGESLVLAYVPSEFSAIRLQGGLVQAPGVPSEWLALLQYNMVIGSHPAHAY